MSKFMRSCHQERCSTRSVHCPVFVVVKMNISSIDREECMSKSATKTIKWIIITMVLTFKSDLDMNFARFLFSKFEPSWTFPDIKCFPDGLIYFSLAQPGPGVFSNSVGQVLDSPSRSLQNISLKCKVHCNLLLMQFLFYSSCLDPRFELVMQLVI